MLAVKIQLNTGGDIERTNTTADTSYFPPWIVFLKLRCIQPIKQHAFVFTNQIASLIYIFRGDGGGGWYQPSAQSSANQTQRNKLNQSDFALYLALWKCQDGQAK